MRLLVSGSTTSLRPRLAARPDRLGVLLTPGNGNREWWGPDVAWGCDNGCFKGLDAPAFLRLLARVLGFASRPLWVTAPDVVGDAAATLRHLAVWGPLIRSLGLRVALVGQDGLTPAGAPWGEFDALFVGGSTAWKLGDDAARLTLDAHARGLPVHVGRVNTLRRITYLARRMRDGAAWVDTIDGGTVKFGEVYIPKLVEWIDRAMADRQTVLFGGTA